MKKVILKVQAYDEKARRKALKVVSAISGIQSISINMEEQKLTVIGDVDPIEVVKKLKKLFHAEIESVGQEEDDGKKDDGKENDNENAYGDLVKAYEAYYKHPYPYYPLYYEVAPQDDYPNNFRMY